MSLVPRARVDDVIGLNILPRNKLMSIQAPSNLRSIAILVLSILLIPSCALNMDKMRDVFQESVQGTVGNSLEYLKHSPTRAFIGVREAIEIVSLDDGRLIHVYDYWKGTAMKRNGQCKVFLYFNEQENIVMEARSEGPGCYTAY